MSEEKIPELLLVGVKTLLEQKLHGSADLGWDMLPFTSMSPV